jgi:hypothetical protein
MLSRSKAVTHSLFPFSRRCVMIHGVDKDINTDLGKELTFAKLGLMHEIVNVLQGSLSIGTPSPI